jgi:peptidoglycan lytic transglycosylase
LWVPLNYLKLSALISIETGHPPEEGLLTCPMQVRTMNKLLVIVGGAALIALPSRCYAKPHAASNFNVPSAAQASMQVGVASWYGEEFAKHPTASGEPYDPNGLTAANLSLPLGTWVKVTNLHNKRTVLLRINDRGPYIMGRILDVSEEAARRLGFRGAGLAAVRIVCIRHPQNPPASELGRIKRPAPDPGSSAEQAIVRVWAELLWIIPSL